MAFNDPSDSLLNQELHPTPHFAVGDIDPSPWITQGAGGFWIVLGVLVLAFVAHRVIWKVEDYIELNGKRGVWKGRRDAGE